MPFMQARFQAQQMVEKEEKMLAMLEHREDQAVRRVTGSGTGYRQPPPHSASMQQHPSTHSANSISSGSGSSRYTDKETCHISS